MGIANVMVISVLERRSEIGLRRALGATKGHVALQFLGEALLLAVIGGVGGVALGAGVTATWASYRGWAVLVPPVAIYGGLAAALIIGTIAGLYPRPSEPPTSLPPKPPISRRAPPRIRGEFRECKGID